MAVRYDATPEEVEAECEKLGEFLAEAYLIHEKIYFSGKDAIVRAWLLKKRSEREGESRSRESAILRAARSTATASWVLAVGTVLLVCGTLWIGQAQLRDAQQTRVQRSKDAKEFLRVEVSIELDKEFDSLEMRQARRRLAGQLLHHKNLSEDRVPDFFEKVGLYMQQGRIDEDTVYNDFSGMVEYYWPALKTFVAESRRADNAPDEYVHFEALYHQMINRDKNGPGVVREPTSKEIMSFLKSEEELPQ